MAMISLSDMRPGRFRCGLPEVEIARFLSSVSKYFVHLASRGSVMKALPELCDYVKETQGMTFEDAARIFDSYAFDNFGLACGRVHLIFR